MPSSLSERAIARRKLRGVAGALLFEDAFDLAAPLQIAHDDKIPRLREADANRVMGRDDDARENFVRDLIGEKVADVAAAECRRPKSSGV
jgi:hypothetical protein